MSGWIGVDFDGTLSHYEGWQGKGRFGEPVALMLDRVRAWIAAGKTVKIVTARAVDPEEVQYIKDWLDRYGLPQLEITDRKDFSMIELWDDRAIQVECNTGRRMDGTP